MHMYIYTSDTNAHFKTTLNFHILEMSRGSLKLLKVLSSLLYSYSDGEKDLLLDRKAHP